MSRQRPAINPLLPPHPLREYQARDGSPESRLGDVIRSLEQPARLSREAHARVTQRLRDASARRGERLLWLPRPVFVVAIAIVLGLIGIAAHAGISWIRRVGPSWTEPPPTAEPSRPVASSRIHHRMRGGDADLSPRAPVPEPPPPEPSTPALPERRAAPRPAARSLAGFSSPARGFSRPAKNPSLLAQEARLLARAFDQLRTRRDYPGALATLDEYDARFRAGMLRSEATLARLDALMGLGRPAVALSLLDEIALAGPRPDELLVLRGELRANSGRLREAIQDFDRVLSRKAPRSLHERALYGRASARLRLGDARGATGDFEEYLSRFPDGKHAAEVRQKSK